jgi:hypothetical protein
MLSAQDLFYACFFVRIYWSNIARSIPVPATLLNQMLDLLSYKEWKHLVKLQVCMNHISHMH